MILFAIKIIAIWLIMVVAAIFNGLVRDQLMTPLIGSLALPLSGITLSLLLFLITYYSIELFGNISRTTCFMIGSTWVILTLIFEYLFGHFVMQKSWQDINQVFIITDGNLFTLVLVVTCFLPWIATAIRKRQPELVN